MSPADPGSKGQLCPVSCCAGKLTQRRPAECRAPPKLQARNRKDPLSPPRCTEHRDPFPTRDGRESTVMDCLELPKWSTWNERGLRPPRLVPAIRTKSDPLQASHLSPGRLPVGRMESNELQRNSSETPVNSRNRGPE
ncbi:hypothetical protein QR685DRAFT_600982 [Neurospora intermedia]|uniref:Uncharacterized protein n=1 Tax=Neurospora intermedia TaxID=5142 RepID=A0ABR3CZA5_NEUIN